MFLPEIWRRRLADGLDRLPLLKRPAVDSSRPIFIWGNGESGTFLLYDALSLSDEVCFWSTRGFRKKGLFDPRYHSSTIDPIHRKPVEGIVHFWAECGLKVPPYDRTILRDEPVDLEAVRARYLTVFRDWIWSDTRRRILDKMPTYILMVDLIDRLFPDARHVFVLRDPRSVVNSIVKRFKRPNEVGPWVGNYPSGFYSDIMLEGWRDVAGLSPERRHAWQVSKVLSVGLAHRQLLGNRLLMTRHEDFCENTHQELSRILDHCDLKFGPAMRRFVPTRLRSFGAQLWHETAVDGVPEGWDIDGSEFPDLQGLADLAEALGYDRARCGRVVGPVDEAAARSALSTI